MEKSIFRVKTSKDIKTFIVKNALIMFLKDLILVIRGIVIMMASP